MIYYIYEVPGHKNGATNDWDKRSQQNFEKYRIHPVVIETMEGPNTPEMWQIVGDREWELADLNGYRKGEHYLAAREKRRLVSVNAMSRGGKTQGDANTISRHIHRIQKQNAHLGAASTNSKRKQCTICGYESTPAGMYNHHKKCKA